MKEKLIKLIQEHPLSWLRPLKKQENRHLYELLNAIDEYAELSIAEKIFWYLNDLHAYPKCKICGNDISHKARCNPLNGYATEYCSIRCAIKDKDYIDKRKRTLVEKYGVDSYAKSQQFKDTVKKIFSNRTVDEQNVINDKRKATCIKKYGVDSISKVKSIKDKCSKTYKSKNEFQKKEIQDKIRQTKIEKYGKDYMHSIMANANYKSFHKKSYMNMLKCVYAIPMFSFEEYEDFKSHNVNQFLFKCKKCGKEYKSSYVNGAIKTCKFCRELNNGTSKQENELANFINSLNVSPTFNSRKEIRPLELDVVIKSHNIAIEFDGLYWHSDDIKGKKYHIEKTDKCENANLQLIHVFENEWICKQDIVKSRIKNLLGIYDKTVFARKCIVKEVDNKISNNFQEENHIQGAVNSKISLGLFYEDELISLMTFGKCRFDKKHEWELLRFCNKLGYHVPGAAGKLLKFFERNYSPKNLISYADRRWSKGKLYEALGFKLDHISLPNYWYVENNKPQLLSRLKFQKHKLKSILAKYDDKLSEVANMKNNGYLRIFDCGNLVYVKTY